MADSVIFPGEVAEDFIVSLCTGMGYRRHQHAHDGYEPHITVYPEDPEKVNFLAIRRVSDGKIFVAEIPAWDSSPYSESDNHLVDEFGGVKEFLGDGKMKVVVPTPDVTFKEAILMEIPRKDNDWDPYEQFFVYVN